jgi:hypothetical protein
MQVVSSAQTCLVAGGALAGAGLRRQGFDAHALHQRGDVAPADLHALAMQHARAHEGELHVQLVQAAHEVQVRLADGPRQLVHRAAAHAQQLGLARDGQGVITVDQGFALSNPALLSARSKRQPSRSRA